MTTKTLPHDFPQSSQMKSSFPSSTQILENQEPSSPPAALTVVLSVACGAVATCILVTIVLLLLRHRSHKQAFRQGERASYGAAAVATDKAPYLAGGAHVDSLDGTSLTLNTPDAVVAYLPILHSRSPSLTPAGHLTSEPGRVLSLTYPKRVHLGSSRSSVGISLPPHIV